MKESRILFLDIETVSGKSEIDEIPERLQTLWKKKSRRFLSPELKNLPTEEVDWNEVYKERAAILAEFGKIICISVGFLVPGESENYIMRVKSFAGDDEQAILSDFSQLVEDSFSDRKFQYLCGHNVREFDLPYIGRRLLIHNMPLPDALNFQGKKPWELKHIIDTLELWKFGDYKHYTSLDLLAAIFDIPSPKEDIDGSQVGKVYWVDNDLDRISRYCERDVWVTAAVYLKLQGLDFPSEDDVVYT